MPTYSPTPAGSPLIVFEDPYLLVVNKPASWNTHAPSPFAGEGIYDWLRHREARWAKLAIIHRLDKETSGLLAFANSAEANRSLTAQFTQHSVRKTYLLLTDRPVQRPEFRAVSVLVRTGEKYVSRPFKSEGARAETRFRVIISQHGLTVVEAEPVTGRTHQIRVHAAEHGFPILGDTRYGGTPAARVYLHAAELILKHPVTGVVMTFHAPADFTGAGGQPLKDLNKGKADWLGNFNLREALIYPKTTNAYRIVHGASDGWPGWYLDRLGEFLFSQSENPPTRAQISVLERLLVGRSDKLYAQPASSGAALLPCGVYHKTLRRTAQGTPTPASPQHLIGDAAPERFIVRENDVQFELSFSEGYSVGLFLDQRDNRRRFLVNHVAADFPLFSNPALAEVLNTFAYTCAFSVCAAKTGAKITSVDLSKKYLEWGKRNFSLNQIDPARHDFLHGDVFEWLRRLARKQRLFDAIILDPPTFSRSQEHGVFKAEKHYGELVLAALGVLRRGGVLFASSNAATWRAEDFLAAVSAAIGSGHRRIVQQHYIPQPPDFPISRMEPAYLKTVWMRIE